MLLLFRPQQVTQCTADCSQLPALPAFFAGMQASQWSLNKPPQCTGGWRGRPLWVHCVQLWCTWTRLHGRPGSLALTDPEPGLLSRCTSRCLSCSLLCPQLRDLMPLVSWGKGTGGLFSLFALVHDTGLCMPPGAGFFPVREGFGCLACLHPSSTAQARQFWAPLLKSCV